MIKDKGNDKIHKDESSNNASHLPNESLGRFHLSAASCFNSSTFVFRFTPLSVIGITNSEFICTPSNSSMIIIVK